MTDYETDFMPMTSIPRARAIIPPNDNYSKTTDHWISDFIVLKRTIESAVDDADFSSLQTAVDSWKEFLKTSPACIFQEAILINPLAKAIEKQRRTVVEFLIKQRNMNLEHFHPPTCQCRLCQRLHDDSRFLQRYADLIICSLASPYYILCAHPDSVIEFCMSIIKNVRNISDFLTEKSVATIETSIEDVMMMTLQGTSNRKEVRHLLQDSKRPCVAPEERTLGRVIDFTDARLKNVLHHPASQMLLQDEWTGRDRGLKYWLSRLEHSSYPLMLLGSVFFYAILLPLTILFPHPRLVKLISTPIVKLQVDFVSFWIFLAFGIVSTGYTYTNVLMVCQGRHENSDMNLLIHFQLIFSGFVVAKMLRFVSCIIFTGKHMFVGGYDRLHFLSVLLYAIGNILILISTIIVPKNVTVQKICKTILKIPNITEIGENCKTTNNIYSTVHGLQNIITTIREPYLIGSVLFTCGHLTYFVSSGHALYMVREIAMFTIAVQKMVVDVVKWAIFFLIFLMGWSLAMQMLYSSYHCGTDYFKTLDTSLTEYFWVVFAMTGTTDYKITTPNGSSSLWSRLIVEYLGMAMYVAFFIVGTLILVNLLIALMSVTYQKIEDERIREICYWQSKVRIKFILWKDCLPVPFNLLYPFFLLNAMIWLAIIDRDKLRSMFPCQPLDEEEILNEEECQLLLMKQEHLFFELDSSAAEDETNIVL